MTSQKKNYLETAEEIARQAHIGQTRWGGQPYISHPQRVAQSFSTPTLQATSWLHDVVEDTDVSLRDLENLGIPGPVLSAVKAITKRDGEEYIDYIKRVAKEPTARKVKIKDIEDNMSDHPKCTNQRKGKYMLAKWILEMVDSGKWEV